MLIALGSTSVLQYIYNTYLIFSRKTFLNAVKGSQGIKRKDFQKLKLTPPGIHLIYNLPFLTSLDCPKF